MVIYLTNDVKKLPSVSTCFTIFYLPKYENIEVLE